VPNFNNLGKLLSLKQQPKAFQIDGVLTQFWHRKLPNRVRPAEDSASACLPQSVFNGIRVSGDDGE
jgi:hypothetical protein